MAPGTERHQPVEIEVRAYLGALDDLLDFGLAVRTPRTFGLFRKNQSCAPSGSVSTRSSTIPASRGSTAALSFRWARPGQVW